MELFRKQKSQQSPDHEPRPRSRTLPSIMINRLSRIGNLGGNRDDGLNIGSPMNFQHNVNVTKQVNKAIRMTFFTFYALFTFRTRTMGR